MTVASGQTDNRCLDMQRIPLSAIVLGAMMAEVDEQLSSRR
jgi:hypothetical protein